MAGQEKNLWFRRARTQAEILIKDPKVIEWLESYDTTNANWALAMLTEASARGIHPLAAGMLGSFRMSGKLPTKFDTSMPINVWSPKHRIYGPDVKDTRSKWYFDSEQQGEPVPRDDTIYLALHPTTTRSDMEFFMSRYWPGVAELLRDLSPGTKRLKTSEKVLRDQEIRARRAAGESYTSLVKEFGLSKRRVEQIAKFKS